MTATLECVEKAHGAAAAAGALMRAVAPLDDRRQEYLAASPRPRPAGAGCAARQRRANRRPPP
eukprot:6636209-Prymnesium_polylepis.1